MVITLVASGKAIRVNDCRHIYSSLHEVRQVQEFIAYRKGNLVDLSHCLLIASIGLRTPKPTRCGMVRQIGHAHFGRYTLTRHFPGKTKACLFR